jgi:hypothetical protein
LIEFKSTLFCNSNEFTGKTVCADVIDPVKSEYNVEDLRLAEMDVSVGILLCVIFRPDSIFVTFESNVLKTSPPLQVGDLCF